MRRPTAFGWLLIATVLVTVVLSLVFPPAGLGAAIILALLLFGVLAEGWTPDFGMRGERLNTLSEHKRQLLRRSFPGGRPRWETTPPDHADESQDQIWARERARRGLG